jgi:uncharacterized protein (TIGR02594 family)
MVDLMSPDPSYLEYDYVDLYSPLHVLGKFDPPDEDVAPALDLAKQMPTTNHFAIMQALAAITTKGTTGEYFNERWKRIGNPLIIKFFHDVGYAKTPYPGDCTPWCAATVSWCLQRSGLKIPSDPASSQGFLSYGRPVTSPSVGDLCVFTDIDDNAHGHVGLFVSSPSPGFVEVLGGNQCGSSLTNCGPGFRQSKVTPMPRAINKAKELKVSSQFLAAYVRPT